MKGVIFTILQDMVESQLGIEMWDAIIEESELPSEGIYTSAASYDDAEIYTLVAALSEKTKLSAPALLESFGEYLFPKLHSSLPEHAMPKGDFFNFLKKIDSVIHVEVKKLDELAEIPEILVDREQEDSIVLHYRSAKKMCYLAIGLLKGAAAEFGENIELEMPICMHDGHDFCELILTVK